MFPFVANGDVWRVVRVAPSDPFLVDRTSRRRIATTDPLNKVIRISEEVTPSLIDKVVLHEVAHALTESYGLSGMLRDIIPDDYFVFVDEWSAQLIEDYGIEAIDAASRVLGRPVCVRGYCR